MGRPYPAHGRGTSALLENGRVLTHPFVIGELAVGNLPRRHFTLSQLAKIPQVTRATDAEVLKAIELHQLISTGAGYIDIHLLMSVKLTPDTFLWTRDKNLLGLARKLSMSFERP